MRGLAIQQYSLRIKGINQVEKACGDFITEYCDECGEKYYVHLGCGKRTCENCAEKRAKRLFLVIQNEVKEWRWKAHIILTMRRQSRLKEGVRELKDSFSRLKRIRIKVRELNEKEREEIKREFGNVKSIGWKDVVERAIGVIETKPKPDGWHIHAHILVNTKWFPQWLLSKLWEKATRGKGNIVYIKRVWGEKQAIWEVVKYITKISKMREERKEEFERDLKNISLIVRWRVKSSLDKIAEITEPELRCDICGGRLVRIPELSRRYSKEEILNIIFQREAIDVGDRPF